MNQETQHTTTQNSSHSIAQHEQPNPANHNDHHEQHSAAPQHGGGHDTHGEVPPDKVFDHLLSELGDHHELSIAFGTYEVLPIMLYDEEGFHVWSNPHAMEHDGKYVMFHSEDKSLTAYQGQPVKAANGQAILVNGKPQLASFDMSVTNLVVYQWMGMLVMLIAMIIIGRKYKKNPSGAPSGLQNAFEALVVYIRDEVVRPNVGTKRVTNSLMPYFLSLFFFIFILDYIGLLPGMHAATGAIGVTAALAITSFIIVNYTAIKEGGIGSWFHHLLGGAPVYLSPIMVPIEIIGLFTKPFALTVRLFANMTAGHVVLLSLIGLIFLFQTLAVAPVTILFSVFVYFLETLVCFLQAYIFTMLTAVFIGLAIGDHKHEDPHHAHH
ncbi:MAG: F0F1 ATP synthase subunit A [Candidatus Kapabacteria bacterium]|nr:F0F1 ATP synthase subunit A [Candidatus Kapabacteria bacterium]